MTDTIKVPDIGDFKDVPVIEVYVKPGQTIAAEVRSSRWNPTRRRWMFPRRRLGSSARSRSRSATR